MILITNMNMVFTKIFEQRLCETQDFLMLTSPPYPLTTLSKAAAANVCISLPIWPHKGGKKYQKCPVMSPWTIDLHWCGFLFHSHLGAYINTDPIIRC